MQLNEKVEQIRHDFIDWYFNDIKNTATKVYIDTIPCEEYWNRHKQGAEYLVDCINHLAEVSWETIDQYTQIIQTFNRKRNVADPWIQKLRLNDYIQRSIAFWQKFYWMSQDMIDKGQRSPIFATQCGDGWFVHPGATRHWVVLQGFKTINVFYTFYDYDFPNNGCLDELLKVKDRTYLQNEEASWFVFEKNGVNVINDVTSNLDKLRYKSAMGIKQGIYDKKLFKNSKHARIPDDFKFLFTNEKVANDAPSFFEFFDFIELKYKLEEKNSFNWGNFMLYYIEDNWRIKWHTKQN